MKEGIKNGSVLWSGQFLEFYVVNRVHTIRLVQRLKGILHARKKERKKVPHVERIMSNSTLTVDCTNARRLGHPARAFERVLKTLFAFEKELLFT